MTSPFCNTLMQASASIWEQEKQHPFVQGLGNGSLDVERFRFYLEQDYLFLIEYAKVFAMGVVKCQQLDHLAYFASLCADTLNGEMALHRSYCAEFGITPQALEQVPISATTSGYAGHLQRTALCGTLADIIASVLPCQWGYHTIARHLQSQGMPPESRYAKWILLYASPEFEAYGAWLRNAMEEHAKHASDQQKQHWVNLFQQSSRWELLFWDMAWYQQRWHMAD